MPTTGGVYSLPPSYFAIAGTTIRVEQHNPPLEDIAQALTDRLMRDGTAPMTGNLAMGGNNITGAGSISAASAGISGNITLSSGAPAVKLVETDGTSTHNRTWIVQSGDALAFQTRDNTDSLVAVDYAISKGSSGATSHAFSIGGTEAMRIEAAGASISDAQAAVTKEKGDARYLQLTGGTIHTNPLIIASQDLFLRSNTTQMLRWQSAAGDERVTQYRDLATGTFAIGVYDGSGANSAFYRFDNASTVLGGSTSVLRRSDGDGRYVRGVSEGSQISVTGGISGYTVAHADTSSIANSSNSNGTVIQSLTWDANGHSQTVGTVNLDSRYLLAGTNQEFSGAYLRFTNDGSLASPALQFVNTNNGIYWDVGTGARFTAGGVLIGALDGGTSLPSDDYIVTRGAGDVRYARLDVSVGSVGTYAMCRLVDGTSVNAGATKSGSALKYSNAGGTNNTDTSPSGTWRCMGEANQVDSGKATTLWLRIS